MATTRRRDKDPVKVTGEPGKWRIQYYDSGVVGIGRRINERNNVATVLEIEHRAEEIRSLLRVGGGRIPRNDDLFGEVCREYIAQVGPAMKPGTRKNYRRDINSYILPVLKAAPVRELQAAHYALVLDGVVSRGLSRATLDGAIRTLGAIQSWAQLRRWMPATAFGTPGERKELRRQARSRLPRKARIDISHVPPADEVERFAVAMQGVYARGGLLVRFLAATGLRFNEALGLTVDDLDAAAGLVRVRRQAAGAWPATAPPKTGVRDAYIWASHRHLLDEVIENADEDGWLFPPDRVATVRGQWWGNRLSERMTAVRRELGWPDHGWVTHSLRHHWVTISLAPRPTGKGLPLDLISRNIGHADSAITLRVYSGASGEAGDLMAALSG